MALPQIDYLHNKRIAIAGFARENKAVLDFLLNHAITQSLTVLDRQLINGKEVAAYKKRGVHFIFGEAYLQGLDTFDVVFRTPGLPRLTPEILRAEKAGARITSQTKLFFELCPAKIIGVTGTKGKGTTSSLIYTIFKKDRRRVFLSGNIGDQPLKLIGRLKRSDWVILELSSYQLQDLEISPHIAVVLNVTSEHLDHHRSRAEYVRAKTSLVRYQTNHDVAVLFADSPTTKSFSKLTRGTILWYSRKHPVDPGVYVAGDDIIWSKKVSRVVARRADVRLLGEHNLENITAAVAAAKAAKIKDASIRAGIKCFLGLENRLEYVATKRGIRWYNDSFATTPESSIVAVKAFSEPTTIIVGGSEKGSDYATLGKVIAGSKTVLTVILIGRMAGRIKAALTAAGYHGKMIGGGKNMQKIVETALRTTEPGSIVLLSPACASFDMFKNYKDRGDQFKKAVRSL